MNYDHLLETMTDLSLDMQEKSLGSDDYTQLLLAEMEARKALPSNRRVGCHVIDFMGYSIPDHPDSLSAFLTSLGAEI